jgi:cytochrome c-type biogenesis protein CcmF
MQIEYVGEQLYWGQLGNVFINLAFVGALLSCVSYFFASRKTEGALIDWKKLARASFVLHALSIIAIFAIMLCILFLHRFEYYYVWQHSNTEMIKKYILSCLWEGQEGSFLLWMFWNALLGLIFMLKAGDWESDVMFVFSMVQVFLVSMILGVVLDYSWIEYKIGSNPFTLLREHPDMLKMPFVQSPTYLEKIDGRGLNPLLQNYWMTIHPPTLFLGFALVLFPFAFAVAGLRRGKFVEWIQPALPWTFLAISILGVGILMGGAWAYEALSFGGFWAWDPVENAVLVPWLCLVAGGHLMLVYKNKGTSLFIAVSLIILSFLLILWSTFLTRSGVLGNSSVHSFTDLGMTAQLLLYVVFFAWLPVVLFIRNTKMRLNYVLLAVCIAVLAFLFGFNLYVKLALFIYLALTIFLLVVNYQTQFPKSSSEESVSSRELWMFVGALLLTVSWLSIIHETSKPAIGKAFDGIPFLQDLYPANYAPASDVIDKYNIVQALLAIFIFVLIGVGQFLRYGKTENSGFKRKMLISTLVSVILTIAIIVGFGLSQNLVKENFMGTISVAKKYEKVLYLVLLYFSVFALVANAHYLLAFVKGKWRLSGPSVAHIGFAMVIGGAVISAGFKQIISANVGSPINLEYLNKDFKNNENIMMSKGDTLDMGGYKVVYSGDSTSGTNVYCAVDYYKPGSNEKSFTLYPNIQMNPRMGNVAEPSTKHFLWKDIYTHITFIDPEKLQLVKSGEINRPAESLETDRFRQPAVYQINEGDTIFSVNYYIIFEDLAATDKIDTTIAPENQRIQLTGKFRIRNLKGKEYLVEPLFAIVNNKIESYAAFNAETGTKISITNIIPEKRKVEVEVSELVNPRQNDFIIMQAIMFPGINILWLGCFLMGIGTLIAVLNRFLKK